MLSYFKGMKALSHLTWSWPNLTELQECAGKLPLSANLEMIASSYTRTRRPLIALMEMSTDPTGVRRGVMPPNSVQDAVFKRTHSETGSHVLLPHLSYEERQTKLQEPIDIPEAKWFTQAFTPLLVSLGEIRMFFVGMKKIYSMHTIKDMDSTEDDWNFHVVETVTPLNIVK
jgi:hypothetical protein